MHYGARLLTLFSTLMLLGQTARAELLHEPKVVDADTCKVLDFKAKQPTQRVVLDLGDKAPTQVFRVSLIVGTSHANVVATPAIRRAVASFKGQKHKLTEKELLRFALVLGCSDPAADGEYLLYRAEISQATLDLPLSGKETFPLAISICSRSEPIRCVYGKAEKPGDRVLMKADPRQSAIFCKNNPDICKKM
ncbi:MAG: hypothetical protein KBE09_01875 [Candidatus Pacebacteria bacterium]|nr:hypothetical protein [Candidatus Paceibacterota bacterium]